MVTLFAHRTPQKGPHRALLGRLISSDITPFIAIYLACFPRNTPLISGLFLAQRCLLLASLILIDPLILRPTRGDTLQKKHGRKGCPMACLIARFAFSMGSIQSRISPVSTVHTLRRVSFYPLTYPPRLNTPCKIFSSLIP